MKSSHRIISAAEAGTLVNPWLQLDDLAFPVSEETPPTVAWSLLNELDENPSPETLTIPQARVVTARGEKQQTVTRWMPEPLSMFVPGDETAISAAPAAGLRAEHLLRLAEARAKAVLENASRQAEDLLQRAQLEAEDALFQAQSQIDEAMQQARQEGRAAGEIAVRAEMEGLLRTSEGILVGIQDWRTRFIAESESIVVSLVKAMAKAVFGDGVVLAPEALQQNFYRITEAARNLGELKIFVHPDDAEQLDTTLINMRSSIIGSSIQVIPSGTITRGGCFVQGQMGSIDARVETQMRTMLESLDRANDPQDGEN